jgi:hypothetical protein
MMMASAGTFAELLATAPAIYPMVLALGAGSIFLGVTVGILIEDKILLWLGSV